MKLIPLPLYKRLLAIRVGESNQNLIPPVDNGEKGHVAQVEALEDDDAASERQETIDTIVSMLSKAMQRKARLLLEVGGINFDRKSLRVTYADGEIGSNLVDLVKYALSPSFIRSKQKIVPEDITKFIEMLQSNPKIPISMYNADRIPKKRAVSSKVPFIWLSVR